MKRSGMPRRTRPMDRGSKRLQQSELRRSGSLARHVPVKRRNAKRRQSEFQRCYVSRERVRFIKSLPCLACLDTRAVIGAAAPGAIENAHTVTLGMGIKANADTIVPLCRGHHRRYDEHRAPFDNEESRAWVQRQAAKYEALWQAHINRDAA